MKAVLTIDMPTCCRYDCPISYDIGSTGAMCSYLERWVEEKPNDCPLRELPEKYSNDHLSSFGGDYYTGYNHCLEDILGNK